MQSRTEDELRRAMADLDKAKKEVEAEKRGLAHDQVEMSHLIDKVSKLQATLADEHRKAAADLTRGTGHN